MATTHAATRAGRPSELGFSLLEAAVVVAIVAIVGASALPSFSALIDARRLDSATTRLAADLQLARSEAIARNRPPQCRHRTRRVCGDDCTAAIAAAVAGGARLLFIDRILGAAEHDRARERDVAVVLVASGALTIVGDVAVHGFIHAASLDWRDGATGFAFVHGALVVAGDVHGNASADIVRDTPILDRLANASGSFVRVNGSWKDF